MASPVHFHVLVFTPLVLVTTRTHVRCVCGVQLTHRLSNCTYMGAELDLAGEMLEGIDFTSRDDKAT